MNLVSGEDADVVAPHLSRDMAQNVVTILKFDPEHGVREGLGDGAFEHNRIFFMLWQNMPCRLVPALATSISLPQPTDQKGCDGCC